MGESGVPASHLDKELLLALLGGGGLVAQCRVLG